MSGLDPELLAAFVPEFLAATARLGVAQDSAAAQRALDTLRAMAEGFGIASLAAMLAEATALLEAEELEALRAMAPALATQAEAIAAAGTDLPPPAGAPPTDPRTAGQPAAGATPIAPHGAPHPPATPPASALPGTAAPSVASRAAAPPQPATPAIVPAIAPEPPARPRCRTLVVDDSPTMRRLIRELLSGDPDFEVVGEAGDGAAALAEHRRLRPELMLLDIEMPVLDGLGALRLWALEGGGAVVVVSSAARPGSATALEARRLGAAAVVGKPSGALSLDLVERGGAALLAAARRAAGRAPRGSTP